MPALSRFSNALIPALVAFALAPAALPAADGTAPSISQFLEIRTARSPVPLPDGSLLVLHDPDGVTQLYRSAPEAGGSAATFTSGKTQATKLTSFPDGVTTYTVSPDGKWVVVMHAPGGNENWQLTLMNATAGPEDRTTPVLANPKVRAAVNVWLMDGSGFIYSANADSPTDFHLYRYDIAAGATTRVLAKKGAWNANGVTRDGKRVLVTHVISQSDRRVFELEVATGKLTELTIHPENGTAACQLVGYMPDERKVLMLSDLKNGQQRLYLRDLKGDKVTEPIPALSAYELDGANLDHGRELLAVVANQDGYGVPHLFSLPDFKPLPPPTDERGVLGLISFRQRTLVWSLSNARTPGLAFATTYPKEKGAAPATRQLTWADTRGLDLSRFPLPEVVTYESFDGVEVHALLYVPEGYRKGSPIPFLAAYHGGPESQSRPSFNATIQYYIGRGYGVIQPNVRGSTGYGRAFHEMDNYKKRWDSVRDGVDAAEWLVANGYAEPGRISTYGGSYGGFMAVACLVEDQERVDRGQRKERLFGACVTTVGIVNLKTFLEKTSGYRRELREVEYGPLSDPEFLASVSSIHRVDKIRVPVFIGHGFNDPRVPVEEAMQLAAALRERGQNPRMFVAPDEGHGFAKLDNRIYFGERVAAFLDETIGGAPPGSTKPVQSAAD